MKKAKLAISGLVSIILLAILLSSCRSNAQRKAESNSDTHPSFHDNIILENSNSKPYLEKPDESTLLADEEASAVTNIQGKLSIYQTKQKIIYEDSGVSWEWIGIEQSKSLPSGTTSEEFIYFNEAVGEDGELLDDNTYVMVSVHIKNISSSDQSYYVNNGGFLTLNENDEYDQMSSETRYQSLATSIPSEVTQGYFACAIKANESIEITLGYIVPDSILDSEALYYSPQYDHKQLYLMER